MTRHSPHAARSTRRADSISGSTLSGAALSLQKPRRSSLGFLRSVAKTYPGLLLAEGSQKMLFC